MTLIVIIPVYKKVIDLNFYEILSIRNTIDKCREYSICFCGPEKLALDYQKKFPGLMFVSFCDKYFQNINGYNKLLKSKNFYERFLHYRKMIIVQCDVWLFNKKFIRSDLLEYDFLGAPVYNELNGNFVGLNGGFSIRDIRKCYFILDRFILNKTRLNDFLELKFNITSIVKSIYYFIFKNNINHYLNNGLKINEDIFWSNLANSRIDSFKIPIENIVLPIYWEKFHNYQWNTAELPLVAHGFWNYELNNWIKWSNIHNIKLDFLQH